MLSYQKPIVLLNEDLAEGIYAASGDGSGGGTKIDVPVTGSGSDCWTVSGWIHQVPEGGRQDYRIQLNAYHDNSDRHLSHATVTITFNQPISSAVCYSSTSCTYSGSTVTYGRNIGTYNSGESLGLGDLIVTSGDNLNINSISINCEGIGQFSPWG